MAMRNIWKAFALAVVCALGLVSGASAHAGWWRWPVTTTTTPTTTTTAATQTSTSGQYTTTVSTTPPPPTSTGSVQIVAPLNYTPYSRGSTSTVIGDIHSATGGVACSISFGDGTPPAIVPAVQVAADDYRCYASHLYLTLTGWLTVDVAATGADGTAVGEASIEVVVV